MEKEKVIKKVIKSAEICLEHIDESDCPQECPYFEQCNKYEKRVIFQPLIRDALALLKEQDPPTKEELMAHYGKMYKCRKCGLEWYQQSQKYCQQCGTAVRWT